MLLVCCHSRGRGLWPFGRLAIQRNSCRLTVFTVDEALAPRTLTLARRLYLTPRAQLDQLLRLGEGTLDDWLARAYTPEFVRRQVLDPARACVRTLRRRRDRQ
jgi:hypothetical protein